MLGLDHKTHRSFEHPQRREPTKIQVNHLRDAGNHVEPTREDDGITLITHRGTPKNRIDHPRDAENRINHTRTPKIVSIIHRCVEKS